MIVRGNRIDVAGVTTLTAGDDPRIKCVVYPRPTWCRQLTLHKTIADDPEKVLAGAGPRGGALATIVTWAEEKTVDGAHGVLDYDGTLLQLADLATQATNHATASNHWSAGFEMKELPGGGVYQATLDAMVAVTIAAARALGIQLQMPRLGSYTGHPIPRMNEKGTTPGGPDMVGVFGHRDNTERRGHWDPGDVIFQMLAAAGVEQFDFAAGEDLEVWARRQKLLNVQHGAQLTCDGVPGPATVAALKAAGYRDGIWALGQA